MNPIKILGLITLLLAVLWHVRVSVPLAGPVPLLAFLAAGEGIFLALVAGGIFLAAGWRVRIEWR